MASYYKYYLEDYSQIKKNSNNFIEVDENLLCEILKVQSPSGEEKRMIKFITDYIKQLPGVKYESDKMGNIYISKGNTKNCTCLVAHMDEVHDFNKHRIISKVGDYIIGFCNRYGVREGIGGDDKVGIYIALEMLNYFDNLKIFFPVQEEIGCKGTKRANMNFFKDVGSLIQCDRGGDDDFITTTNSVIVTTDDFYNQIKDIVEAYDYSKATGTITDIGELVKQKVGVSAFNISCGYYNAHMDDELIYLPALTNCLNLIYYIINDTNGTLYPMDKIVYAAVKTYTYTKPAGATVANATTGYKTPYKEYPKTERIDLGYKFPEKGEFVVPCNSCVLGYDCLNCDYFNDRSI